MKPPRIFLLFLAALLSACATEVREADLRQTSDGNARIGHRRNEVRIVAHGIDLALTAPPGWKSSTCLDKPMDFDAVLLSPGNENAIAVTVVARNARWDKFFKGHTEAYVRSLHHHWDDEIVLHYASAVALPNHGRLVPVYRFSSAYWGRRFNLFIPEGKAVVKIEYESDLRLDEQACHRLLESVLSSYRVNTSS